MEKKGKSHKTKFKFDENCLNYEIQLKQINYKWLWWLLIPLILLLMLIPLEKDLNVKVESQANVPIASAEVEMEFNPRFLYKNGEFFAIQRYFNAQKTNAEGIARFERIHYSVFSIVFQLFSSLRIQCIADGFKPNEVMPLFHFHWHNSTIIVRLEEIVMKTLLFQTLDGYDQSLLSQVGLTILVNDEPYRRITDSRNGQFSLVLPADSRLSIKAEKQGFETNQTISDRLVSELVIADQSERDIIMELPPCSVSGDDNTQSSEGSIKEYDMKQDRGVFRFDYDTDSAPDRIIVYNCRAKDRKQAHVIFDKEIGTQKKVSEKLIFTSRIITVEVIGTTKWEYIVNCPD